MDSGPNVNPGDEPRADVASEMDGPQPAQDQPASTGEAQGEEGAVSASDSPASLEPPHSPQEPVVSEPVVSEPVVSEPVVSEPVVSEPVSAGEPAAPQWPAFDWGFSLEEPTSSTPTSAAAAEKPTIFNWPEPAVPEPAQRVEKSAEQFAAEQERQRRFLVRVLSVLGVAAVLLLGILVAMVARRPAGPIVVTASEPGQPAGYPIKLVRAITGYGRGAKQTLDHPLGVAFGENNTVWISDTGNSRVLVFDTSGRFVRTIGTDPGPNQIRSPYGIVVDPSRHRVYVADWTGGAVRIYSSAGAYVDSLPAAGQNPAEFGGDGFTPYDVRLAGDRIVASSNDGLYFFDSRGLVSAKWGSKVRGRAPGEFNFPDAFDVDPKTGRIYVADSLNRRVVALDTNGRVLWVSGAPDKQGKIIGFWQLPKGLAVGPDHNVYVVDTFRFEYGDGVGHGHIVVLSPDGKLLSEFGRAGSDAGSVNFPEGLAARADGLWAIADRANNRVLLFKLGPLPTPKGREAETYAQSLATPSGATAARSQ